jgi:hypothetical protein
MIYVITVTTKDTPPQVVEVFAGTGRLPARAALIDHLGWSFDEDEPEDEQVREQVAALRRAGHIDEAYGWMQGWLTTDYIVQEHTPILHTYPHA